MTNDIIWDCETYPNVFTLHPLMLGYSTPLVEFK